DQQHHGLNSAHAAGTASPIRGAVADQTSRRAATATLPSPAAASLPGAIGASCIAAAGGPAVLRLLAWAGREGSAPGCVAGARTARPGDYARVRGQVRAAGWPAPGTGRGPR